MNISQNKFFQLFGSGQPTVDVDLEGMDYGSTQDRLALLALARHVQPKTVIEFGLQRGMTARMLIDELPCIRKYVGIDLSASQVPALDGQLSEKPAIPGELVQDEAAVRIICRDSRKLAAKDLPNADFIYIDGGHDEETVMHDSLLAIERIKLGGAIVWHDYNNRTVEVNRVIDRLNHERGDHICLVDGTWVCFAFAATLRASA